MRGLVSTAIVAVVVSLLTVTAVGVIAQESAQVGPAAVSSINAHRVDGRHAVGAGASIQKRRKKLVATDKNGDLPSNIVKPFWDSLKNVPPGFADGVDNRGVTKITITRVVGSVLAINAGATSIASADCPAGAKVTGGGFAASSTDLLVDNTFDNGNGSWVVQAKNTSASQKTLQVVVNCISTTPSNGIATSRKGPKIAVATK